MRGRKRLPNLDPERKSPCFASTDLSTLVPAPLSGADGTEAMGLGLPKPTRLSLSPSPRHGDSPFFLGPLRGGRAGLCRKHFTPWKSAPALSKDRALPWAVPRGLRGSHPRRSRPPSGTAAWVSSGSLKPRARCSLGAFGRAVASASARTLSPCPEAGPCSLSSRSGANYHLPDDLHAHMVRLSSRAVRSLEPQSSSLSTAYGSPAPPPARRPAPGAGRRVWGPAE